MPRCIAADMYVMIKARGFIQIDAIRRECLLPQTRILSACVFCVYNDGIIGKGGIFFIGLKA